VSTRDNLLVSAADSADVRVLTIEGELDSTTYRPLRDAVIKCALDEPRAIVIDVSTLVVPAASAWVVFTSAQWHVGQWPGVPMALACSDLARRRAIARNGVARYLPLYSSTAEAISAMHGDGPPSRRRARAELPAEPLSVGRSRDLVNEWLTAWSRSELISVAKLVVTVLVENVLAHTESAPAIRLESDGDLVTISVEDCSSALAVRHEECHAGGTDVSGLAIVAAVSRRWGNLPTPSGKTVWAAIGPGSRL